MLHKENKYYDNGNVMEEYSIDDEGNIQGEYIRYYYITKWFLI